MAGVRVTYQPFSLQERMAPLNMMKEEYDTVNEGLSELGMTANQVAQYIDPASQAGQTLAQYNKLLDDTASTLSREGLKGVSRTTLQNLRRMYQKQVAPINESAKNYASLQAKIKEMQWKDPTIMVEGMPTLDDYIKNPNALPNLVSGNQLMKEGVNAAYQLEGVDYDTISRYMRGDNSAIPGLDKTVEQIAQSYGISSQQALNYISRGVLTGLGERATKLDMQRQAADLEYGYKMKALGAQEAKERRIAAIKHGYSMAEIQERNKGKASSSRSGSGSGRSGASYLNQVDGVVYAKGQDERLIKDNKSVGELMNSTKARYTNFMNLDKENKVRVLRALGADVTEDSSTFDIENAMMDFESELSNYTYMEYRDKKDKNNEFFMIPNKVRRDTSTNEDDDELYDITLNQD